MRYNGGDAGKVARRMAWRWNGFGSMAVPHSLSFNSLLKRFRRAAGMTQEALAARAGYSVVYISMLERGTRSPLATTAELLADALDLHEHERQQLLAALATVPRGEPAQPERARRMTAPNPRLIGRAHEVDLIASHLSASTAPLLVLSGEPGIGKTRLLREAITLAQMRGAAVLTGACHRRSGQEPYQPLVSALESYVQSRAPADLRRDLEGCTWLVRLLPELAETAIVPVPSWTLPPEQERRLMFKAVARFLANVAGPGGALLALDDLQWAGADAVDLIVSLVRAAGEARLRIVGAYRETELRPQDPLAAALSDLAPAGFVTAARLGPLSAGEAEALLGTLVEGADEDATLVRQVVQRAGGVPFFLVSCAQGLRAGALDRTATDSVPWDVAQSVRQRVAALPATAQALLGLSAVVGRSIPRAVITRIGSLAGTSQEDLVAGLDAACQARLLAELGEDAYQFPHDLIREVIGADLGAARRATMHLQVAAALEAGVSETPPDQLAHHFARGGDHEKAVHYFELAAERAASMHALAAMELYYGELATRYDGLGRGAQAAAAREKLGATLMTLARYDEALLALEASAAGYRAAGDREGEGRAVAQIGWAHALRGTPEEGIAYLRRQPLVEITYSPRGLAAIHLALAKLYVDSGRYPEQLDAADRALEHATEAGDERLRAQAAQRRGTALLMLARLDEGAEVLEEALPAVEAAGDLRDLSYALNNIGWVKDVRGDFAAAGRFIDRALTVAERMGDPTQIALMLCNRGQIAFSAGDWALTRAHTERARALAEQIGASWVAAWPPLVRGLLDLASGASDDGVERLRSAIALAESSGDIEALRLAHTALAEREMLAGDAEAACARLTPLLDRPGQQESSVTTLMPMLAWALLARGAGEQARALLDQCIGRAAPGDMRPILVHALRVRGLLRAAEGQMESAQAAFAESLALARAMPHPYAEAQALWAMGTALAQHGDHDGARSQLTAALDVCARLGERLYATNAERTLRELLAHPRRRSTRPS
jgi:tetratricopeptide (TPR) repeat protein/transcriptional regulator with XRE-family HTH domain